MGFAHGHRAGVRLVAAIVAGVAGLGLVGCAANEADVAEEETVLTEFDESAADDLAAPEAPVEAPAPQAETPAAEAPETPETPAAPMAGGDGGAALTALNLIQDQRPSFDHGPKPAENQRYIVLHDTEGDNDAASLVDWWDSNGTYVSSHFVIDKDGRITQVAPIDRIAHHAGYGDTGHNDAYGITEDGRDDMRGSSPIGAWASDYGMNAWSVGIEMVHVGGSGDYPEAQLTALDQLIAAIDAYYGFESTIIDHKSWRSGNSDTSPEFASYLANYQTARTHRRA